MKPIINSAQETVVAYLSAYAPLNTESSISIEQIAKDIGYKNKRSIYYAIQRLRDLGAVTLISARHWRATTLICHKREEDFNVVFRIAGGRAERRRREPVAAKPEPVAVAIPKLLPRKLIPYVGKERAA